MHSGANSLEGVKTSRVKGDAILVRVRNQLWVMQARTAE